MITDCFLNHVLNVPNVINKTKHMNNVIKKQTVHVSALRPSPLDGGTPINGACMPMQTLGHHSYIVSMEYTITQNTND